MTSPMIVDVSSQTALMPAWIVTPGAPLQPGIGLDDRDEDLSSRKCGRWRTASGWPVGGARTARDRKSVV